MLVLRTTPQSSLLKLTKMRAFEGKAARFAEATTMNRCSGPATLAVILLAVTLPAWPGRAETPLERGAYLMNGIAACGNCHTQQGPDGPVPGMELAGGLLIEEPGAFTVHTPNITPDPETGIGKWTDAEIVTAIREGRRPDGRIIGPPMPIDLYRQMSDQDVQALVAYLRQVKPVHNQMPPSEYRIPLPESYGPPVGSVPEVARADPVTYGAYLAGPLGHCIECHTPMVEGQPDFAHRLGAGGNPFYGPWGISVSRNITPDPETGIGSWTDDQIRRAITRGISADGSPLMPPMGYHYYANITGTDLDALVAYLRSLKPLGTGTSE
jgi:mono/diheme cytochrome c family protein